MGHMETTTLNGNVIREAYRDWLAVRHDDLLLYNEFSICDGESRADLVALNGTLHGIEIKGETDQLSRLPKQIDVYGRVFDRATLVTTAKHFEAASEIVPDWWGLTVTRRIGDNIRFIRRRRGRANPEQDVFYLALLLWRREALSILEDHGLDRGYRSKPLVDLVHRMCDTIPRKRLCRCVRDTIKARGYWQVDRQRASDDGSSRRHATL